MNVCISLELMPVFFEIFTDVKLQFTKQFEFFSQLVTQLA